MSAEGQNKIYEMVTEKVLDALRNGTVPWRKPWNASSIFPRSMSTRKPYRGINIFLLGMQGYGSPWWGTYDQIAELAGMVKVPAKGRKGYRWESPDGTPRGVRAGEKSTMIVFWKRILVDDKNAPDGKKHISLLRYYRVFNACQADGLPDRFFPQPDDSATVETLDSAEVIIKGYLENGGPQTLKVPGDRAFYVPALDVINLPEDSQFDGMDERYATMFHEFGHSTGHPTRLGRPGIMEFDHFGSGRYAKEELVAEMTAAMLCGVCGIETTVENSAAYLRSWLRKLESDPKLVVQAAAQAQRAADHVRGVTFSDSESESDE